MTDNEEDVLEIEIQDADGLFSGLGFLARNQENILRLSELEDQDLASTLSGVLGATAGELDSSDRFESEDVDRVIEVLADALVREFETSD